MIMRYYEQGKAAFYEGVAYQDNPYLLGEAAKSWNDGWTVEWFENLHDNDLIDGEF